MGAYPNTYVGIYLAFPEQTSIETEQIWVHPESGKKKKWKFNPETGEEMVLKTIENIRKSFPSSYIVEDESLGLREDTFFSGDSFGDEMYFLIDGGDTEHKYHQTLEEHDSHDLHSLDLDTLIIHFKRDYHKYLEYYKEKFGRFEIRYGVVNYMW